MLLGAIFVGWLLAQSSVADGSEAVVVLRAAAAASPRPDDCAGGAGSVLDWDRARGGKQRQYCQALAFGYARLESGPAAALEQAERARRALPERAAPLVLAGRAKLALGDLPGAWQSFERAWRLDRRALETPEALHDRAVVAARLGHTEASIQAYRTLVPRLGLVRDSVRRTRIYVEAAVQVMAAGPAALDESIGYLNEARRQRIPPGMEPYVFGALTLALDRAGRHQQALGLAAEAGEPYALLRHLEWQVERLEGKDVATPAWIGRVPVLPLPELRAMTAAAAEPLLPEIARETWQAFVAEAPPGPWADHARAALARLTDKGQARR
ncbi:MAG TPA: hypothetical protein VKZ49_13430 [Polyangiaceae bacterium]|nr:hypothetical protein [Polyangiaceae bacterium]